MLLIILLELKSIVVLGFFFVQDAVVSAGGGAYLISGNSNNATVSVEDAASTAANMTHATRVSQATVRLNSHFMAIIIILPA